ncbi:tyrosine-type recombinase/integrase (plasmid) [Mycobacterium marinum]|uniref:tyrosine-type recombinase/integrase n=1 Tax=Mycobacterium marinum TaxID=1781 RepID=UPI000CD90D54|nr:tyrosine-type recombinase/integrase [Mycobacterium marinum]WOR07515.1 tyrosine-type recombinase/integrase [Mycobacterium marinum]
MESAIRPDSGEQRFVIVDADGFVHPEATAWLQFLADSGRSPNTARDYGRRVAWYLSWCALTMDWRKTTLSHLALWRRTVAASPVLKTNGHSTFRGESTVGLWMVSVRSFYEWADAHSLLATNVVSRMTELKYFAPGTAAGGEHGATRRVLVDELRSKRVEAPAPRWISDADARNRLADLALPARDRFLIDLLTTTGVRVGEALSLFVADLHFGGGSQRLGCPHADPHLHVRINNPVENSARAKGGPRTLFVHRDVVESYIDYALERRKILDANTVRDASPHLFVNVYSRDRWLGRAMTYSSVKRLLSRCSKRIGYELNGPHMLRHTFATRLIRGIDCDPVPVDVVQALLGHAVLSSTQVYTHDAESAMKAATTAISARPAP